MRAATLFLALLLSLSATTARAAEMPAAVARWYEALRTADADAVSALLAEDAKIELKDLDLVQTRQEFVESMDAWADAIEGGAIETKIAESGQDSATVDVCYRFPGNSQRNRESFVLKDDIIAGIVQEAFAADCDGF